MSSLAREEAGGRLRSAFGRLLPKGRKNFENRRFLRFSIESPLKGRSGGSCFLLLLFFRDKRKGDIGVWGYPPGVGVVVEGRDDG